MSGHDAELVQLKAAVSCALLLERGGYSLDRKDSTKHCLKYRRGAGEVVIVTLWDEGHSTAEIGRRMGVTKNAIVGKAHLPRRDR